MSFKAQLKLYLGWEWEEGAQDKDNQDLDYTLLDGTDINQAEAVFHQENVTLLDGNSTTYDLTALSRTVLGDTLDVTLITVKKILAVNESESGELIIGGAAANEWSEPFGADGDTAIVPPQSPWFWGSLRCGKEVDGTNKNLKIAASGDDVTYSLVIIGLVTPATGECSSA